MRVLLVSFTDDPEYLIEHFAKVSHSGKYADTPEKRREFIKSLISMGHESVLEPVTFTFYIYDISRVTTHQMVRHRIASYCQESERYVTFEGNYVIPQSIACNNQKIHSVVTNYFEAATQLYNELIKNGIPKEDARYVLPQAASTSIMVSMNARELRHFFKLRCDENAQWEIRNVAKEMLKICYDKCPSVFEDLYNKYITVNDNSSST